MLTIQERHEVQNMCLVSCYAGRHGNCTSAGHENSMTHHCLHLYRNEKKQQGAA